jgi:uncharacterized protein YjbI with pentapeptide repeats
MSTGATWTLSIPGLGNVGVYTNEYRYAGGFAIVGFGEASQDFAVTPLTAPDTLALSLQLTDQNGTPRTYYLNTWRIQDSGPSNNPGMTLWSYLFGFESESIGSEQTLKLVNLGSGNIALLSTAPGTAGQYLGGASGGWYPGQFSLGSGSFILTSSVTAFQVGGPQLSILAITGSGYRLDLAGESLAGLDLSGANMQQCNLYHADLSGITGLSRADFTGATLALANLAGLSLSGPIWENTDFTGTDLSTIAPSPDANLRGATLTGASLSGVTLTGADLFRARLGYADLRDATLRGANLAGAVLDGARLAGCDLSSANLTSVDLSGIDLSTVKLEGAILDNANMQNCNLSHGSLVKASLSGANLQSSTIIGLTIGDNDLTGTNFSGLDLTLINAQNFQNSTDPTQPTNLTGATLPFSLIGANWSCLTLTSATIDDMPATIDSLNAANLTWTANSQTGAGGANFGGLTLTGPVFTGATLDGTNFAGATLTGANFETAQMPNVDFGKANLSQSTFQGALMPNAHFSRAILSGVSFVGAALGGERQDEAADFSEAFLETCNFDYANVFAASFADASFGNGNSFTSGTNLSQADFSNAYMSAVVLSSANLQGAKFDGAYMVQADLSGANLSPAETGAAAASLTNAFLQAAVLTNTNLAGADLTGALITDTSGSVRVQYYYKGVLMPEQQVDYPAGTFPDPQSAFNDATTCPNGLTYLTNLQDGKSLATMITVTDPPTSWRQQTQSAAADQSHVLIKVARRLSRQN